MYHIIIKREVYLPIIVCTLVLYDLEHPKFMIIKEKFMEVLLRNGYSGVWYQN